MSSPPILDNKYPDAPSVFEPVALLREARRQKGLAAIDVPPVCILDPDGDIVRRLRDSSQAKRFDAWPCYHTDLYSFPLAGRTSRYRRVCRWSAFRGFSRRRTLCVRMSPLDQPDFGRANRAGREPALFCRNRPGAAR